MSSSLRPVLIAVWLAVLPISLRAQQQPLKDVVPERPIKVPTRKEIDHLEAVKLYGLAAQHEQRSELPRALKTYEKALRLDPDSGAIRRAMLPLYLALDRQQEATPASFARSIATRRPVRRSKKRWRARN